MLTHQNFVWGVHLELIHICLKSCKILGKISEQPHPTLCIQFLNRENNDKNNTFPLGKQVCFTMVWGCAETLPNLIFFHSIQPTYLVMLTITSF